DGAAGEPPSVTVRRRFERPENDIHAVLGGGADDEGQRPDVHQIELQPGQLHDPDRPERAQDQRHHREHGLPDTADHERRDPGDEREGVCQSESERPFDEPCRLVGNDRLSRDVRIDGPQLLHEARLAGPVPEVEPGVHLKEQMPALADELSSQLFGQIAQGERRGPGRQLEPARLLGEVGRQPRLVVGESNLDGAALARLEPLEKSRGRSGHGEDFLRRPLGAAVRTTSRRRFKVSSARVSARRSRGRGPPTRMLSATSPRRWSTASFSDWRSGNTDRTLWTSETEDRRWNAACLPSSSGSDIAVESAANTERPAAAAAFLSQTTDSVPSAWRFNML